MRISILIGIGVLGIVARVVWAEPKDEGTITKTGFVTNPFILEEMGLADYSKWPDRGPTRFVYRVNGECDARTTIRRTFDRVEELVKLTRSKNPKLRAHAVEELSQLHSERAARALTHALFDSDLAVRERAAAALGDQGDRRAVEPLIDALALNTWPIKETIHVSLRRLTGRDYGRSFQQWSAWYDSLKGAP